MNVAILFDSAEEDTKINHPRIRGREIYLYALKTFYMHGEIDHIIYLGKYADTLPDVFENISEWKKESGVDKPVTVLHGIRHFSQVWLHILQSGQDKPEKYVIHDVRFPFVTEKRITDVLQMVGEHGIAMFSGSAEDGMYQIQEGKIEIVHNPRTLRYPVAVRAENHALHCLDEPGLILQDLAYYEPWLCEDFEGNPAVYGSGDIERAEALFMYIGAAMKGSKAQSIPAGEELQPQEILTGTGGAAV